MQNVVKDQEVGKVIRSLEPIAIDPFGSPAGYLNRGGKKSLAMPAVHRGRILMVKDLQGNWVFPNIPMTTHHTSAVAAAQHGFKKWCGLDDNQLASPIALGGYTSPGAIDVANDGIQTFVFGLNVHYDGVRINTAFGKEYKWVDGPEAFLALIKPMKDKLVEYWALVTTIIEMHRQKMLSWAWCPILHTTH